jgi:hypothetical protein
MRTFPKKTGVKMLKADEGKNPYICGETHETLHLDKLSLEE